MFVAPKEPIRIEKVLVESPSQKLKVEAKQLQIKGDNRKQKGIACVKLIFSDNNI